MSGRRNASGVIEPAAARAPSNPSGYYWEPDGFPRYDALPQGDVGILGRLREAAALLSVGAETTVDAGDAFARIAGFRHESPQQRILRVTFPGITAENRIDGLGTGVMVRLVEGVDTRGLLRTVYVPTNGLAISLPAGRVTADVLRGYGEPAPDNTVNITVSHGLILRRWYSAFESTATTVVAVFPLLTVEPAPVFATRARVTVLEGSLASPVSGTPIYLAGQSAIVPVDDSGVITLQAGQVNTLVSIEWEIFE